MVPHSATSTVNKENNQGMTRVAAAGQTEDAMPQKTSQANKMPMVVIGKKQSNLNGWIKPKESSLLPSVVLPSSHMQVTSAMAIKSQAVPPQARLGVAKPPVAVGMLNKNFVVNKQPSAAVTSSSSKKTTAGRTGVLSALDIGSKQKASAIQPAVELASRSVFVPVVQLPHQALSASCLQQSIQSQQQMKKLKQEAMLAFKQQALSLNTDKIQNENTCLERQPKFDSVKAVPSIFFPLPASKSAKPLDEIELTSKPLPEFQAIEKVFVNGECISMEYYLKIQACFDFVKRHHFLYKPKDAEPLELSRRQFETFFSPTLDPEAIFDAIGPLVNELLSTQLPDTDVSNWQALWSIALDEDVLPLADDFALKDFPQIELKKKVDALVYIIDELLQADIFQDHLKDLLRQQTDYEKERADAKRQRGRIDSDICAAGEQYKNALNDLEKFERELEHFESAMDQFADQKMAEWEQDTANQDRMGSRHLAATMQKKRDQILSDCKHQLKTKTAGIKKLQAVADMLKKKHEDLVVRRVAIFALLEKDEENLIEQLRDHEVTWLGCDRYGRQFWHYSWIGGLVIEDRTKHGKQDIPVYSLVGTNSELLALRKALNVSGAREGELLLNLTDNWNHLMTSLEKTATWKQGCMDSCDVMTSERNFGETMVSYAVELMDDVLKIVELFQEFTELKPDASLDKVNMDALKTFNRSEAEEALNKVECLIDLQQLLHSLLLLFQDGFFHKDKDSKVFTLLITAYTDDSNKSASERWFAFCNRPQSLSTFSMFCSHFAELAYNYVTYLESKYGQLKKLRREALKRKSHEEAQASRRRLRARSS